MNKNILFWILAIIQSYAIYYTFSTLVITNRLLIEHVYSKEVGLGFIPESMGVSFLLGGLLAISTIGIEYLIYSKLRLNR